MSAKLANHEAVLPNLRSKIYQINSIDERISSDLGMLPNFLVGAKPVHLLQREVE